MFGHQNIDAKYSILEGSKTAPNFTLALQGSNSKLRVFSFIETTIVYIKLHPYEFNYYVLKENDSNVRREQELSSNEQISLHINKTQYKQKTKQLQSFALTAS